MIDLKYHIIESLRRQATQRPNAPILRYQDGDSWKDMSWEEFIKSIDNVSHALIANDIAVQDKVAIYANNMANWVICDYAIMQARAVTVPSYGTNTGEQTAFILNDADVKIVFVGNQEQYDNVISEIDHCPTLQKVVAMTEIDLRDHPKGYSWENFLQDGHPESHKELEIRLAEKNFLDLFTLIYTSGTTGTPKGVMLTHGNIASQMEAHDQTIMEFAPDDVSLSFLPYSHIYERGWRSVMFHRGVTVAVLDDPQTVREVMQIVKPSAMCTVPRFNEKVYSAVMEKVNQASLLRKLIFRWALRVGRKYFTRYYRQQKIGFLLQKKFNRADQLVLSKLRDIFGGRIKVMPCGGGKLEPAIANFFFDIGINIKPGYGLTESTATVSCMDEKNFNPNSIGKLLPNCEVKIGENDEILVRGGQVMRGYFKNPTASAEAFTEDGFLRTGDVGHIDDQGNLYITDRIKDLMKTSTGKYIAPQTLETKIGTDKFIDQIAIIADAKKYVSALIVPCFESLEEYAKKFNIQYKDRMDLVKNAEIIKMFEQRIAKVQKDFANFEQVKKFTLLHEAFSAKMNEITPTLKLKRKVILERYKKQIEDMYSSKNK